MRVLPLLALLIAASAHAQARLELTDPLLLIDGQRTQVVGAPLQAPSFRTLEMVVPGMGLVLVSDVPFDGARRAGDFDGTRLVLVVNGRSLRLRSTTPLLNTGTPLPAYARLDPSPLTPTEGPVSLRLIGTDQDTPQPQVRATPVSPPNSPTDPSNELARLLNALRAERDGLRAALAKTEWERDDARRRLDALRADVDMLRREISGSRTPVDQLRRERDALRDEVDRLRASLEALGTPAARPASEPVQVTPTRVSLPSFELARLSNRNQIETRLRTVSYPEWAAASGLGGDVLVLFQTDVSGAVIRTAVPRPLGGGLDALAEEIVRTMRFVPVRANGLPTRLRSQVVVRFTP